MRQQTGPPVLSRLLADMNQDGRFPMAVLADAGGLPIAISAATGHMPDRQAAVVIQLYNTVAQAGSQVGLGQIDELTILDEEGQRLVCRPFLAGDTLLILAIVVPLRQQAYRQRTNQVIKAIRQEWR